MQNVITKKIRSGFILLIVCCNIFITILCAQTDTVIDQSGDSSVYLKRENLNRIKSNRLQFMPFRSVNGVALSNPNTYYLKYDRLFVDGLEATSDYIFVDGMQIADGNDFPYRAITEFQLYRMNQPISYGNVAGSMIELKTQTYDDKFHFDLDGYTTLNKGLKNNAVELNIGGPIRFSKTSKSNKKVPVFFIASNYAFTNDPNPSSENKYAVTDNTQRSLSESPLVPSGLSGGGTFLSAEFLGQDDIMEVNTHQDSDRQTSNTFLKLMFPLSKNINLTMGSYAKFDWGKEFVFDNALLNSHNNPETNYRNFDNFLNFDHQFDVNENLKIGYRVNLQYSNYYFEKQDSRHKDRYFEYGCLGKYSTSKIPTYELVDEITIDGITYENVYVLNSWDFDTAYTYQNLNYNPEAARFTEQIYELFPTNWEYYPFGNGNWSNSDQLQLRGGLLNGQNPESVYGLWNSQSSIIFPVGYSSNEKYRGTLQMDVNYKSHNFFIGFEYLKKIERSYSINPMALWSRMRAVTNYHIRQLDFDNPQMDQISNNLIYFYREYVESDQYNFDKNLRAKLGLPVDGVDFILTDSYDMVNNTINYYDKDGVLRTISTNGELYSLDMFSPEELLNNGKYIVNPAGYDYLGNKLKGKQGKYDFFENWTVDAYRPTYFSTFFGDGFRWKSIDISAGLRIDNFDANQPVLKDSYLLYPAKTVGEVTKIYGTPVSHPENIGVDYVVYVDNVNNPTEITGYRDGNTWYNYQGEEIQDPWVLDRGSGISPYLTDPQQYNVRPDAFEDYHAKTSILPQINLELKMDWGNLYLNYNSFSQNPVAFNTFRPDQYYYINNIPPILNNPDLKPIRYDKINIGVTPRIYKTLFADVSYLGVFINDFNYVDVLIGAYPRSYVTVNNLDKVLHTSAISASLNYYAPRSSGIAAGSSFTYTFISDTNNYYMNIPELVANTHLTFNFGKGKEFVLRTNQTVRAIFENFGIGIFHQHRKGTELPLSPIYLNSSVTNFTRNYSTSPDIDLVNLRIEKGIYIKPLNLTASIYFWIENLFDKQNLFYIDPVTGEPDDDGYLNNPIWQQQINNQVNPESYRMLYQYKLKNPDYYDTPRIFRAGLIVKL
jgi:hypothetical protein